MGKRWNSNSEVHFVNTVMNYDLWVGLMGVSGCGIMIQQGVGVVS